MRTPGTDIDNRSENDDTRIFVRSQSVVARVVTGETVIVPVRGKVGDLASIYRFNEVGSLIWRLLEVPSDARSLVSAVAREYDVNPLQAQEDVSRFLNDLASVGLVEISDAMHTIGAEWPAGQESVSAADVR